MHIDQRGRFQPPEDTRRAVEAVNRHARPVEDPSDLDALVERLADADCVLLGEASHGTSEFYRARAGITARLLQDHGFDFVAVEGDWTSCYAANRYVKGLADAPDSARAAAEAFDRWPTWMWGNWEVEPFFEWLRTYNDAVEPGEEAGFYGLDVYGLHQSLEAVVEYLDEHDPEAAAQAREATRCFEPYGVDAQEYARATRMVPESCEDEVVDLLLSLQEREPAHGEAVPDDRFSVEQNALVARNAEEYYRAMVGDGNSWNVRDHHMTETLNRLLDHHGPDATGVVWAHNTHVGDARATDMPAQDRINIGQLAREQTTTGDVYAVGFGSHRGEVVAADAWGDDARVKDVPAATAGSHEHVFHQADPENALLFSEDVPEDTALAEPRGHRAIGVVYHPRHEAGNYVPTRLPERYDAFVHLDETGALHPMDIYPEGERVPELYPSGL